LRQGEGYDRREHVVSGSVEGQLRSLASMARVLGRSERLEIIVEMSAEEARRVVDAASVSISRLEAGTGLIRTIINVGDLGPREERWPVNEIYAMQDFTKLRAVVDQGRTWTASLDDPAIDPPEADLLRELGKGSSMGAPLVVDGSLWGELYATRHVFQPTFESADSAYFEALAAILSGAISRALHVASLEEMAFRDALTGLANRRAVDEAVERALDGVAQRSGQDVCVVLADANGLKSVNDHLGHAEGDRFLRLVARCLSQHFARMPGCLVARVGGDEFCVVVVGHPMDQVVACADDMVRATYALTLGGGVACGVAALSSFTTEEPVQAKALFQAADRAQYDAKRLGLRRAVRAGRVPDATAFDEDLAPR
jgi:diguanylate cyclase (GGDEF)-like protein